MPLDDNDKKAIAEMFKAALAGDDVKAMIGGVFEDRFKAAKLDKFDERVKALVAESTKDLGKSADDKAGEGKAAQDRGADGKFRSEEARRLADLEKQLADEKAAREAEKSKAETARLVQATERELLAAGIPADRVELALAHLHHANGRLKATDGGEPGLVFKRQGYDEVLPLKTGVAEWMKSDQAKALIPPAPVTGTGGIHGNPASGFRGPDGKLDLGSLQEKLAGSLGAALANVS